MSDKEWEEAYRAAWASYYTPEHARTIFRRAAACKASRPEMTLWTVAFFFRTIEIEGVQPLEGGAFRLKFRRDRRSGMGSGCRDDICRALFPAACTTRVDAARRGAALMRGASSEFFIRLFS